MVILEILATLPFLRDALPHTHTHVLKSKKAASLLTRSVAASTANEVDLDTVG